MAKTFCSRCNRVFEAGDILCPVCHQEMGFLTPEMEAGLKNGTLLLLSGMGSAKIYNPSSLIDESEEEHTEKDFRKDMEVDPEALATIEAIIKKSKKLNQS